MLIVLNLCLWFFVNRILKSFFFSFGFFLSLLSFIFSFIAIRIFSSLLRDKHFTFYMKFLSIFSFPLFTLFSLSNTKSLQMFSQKMAPKIISRKISFQGNVKVITQKCHFCSNMKDKTNSILFSTLWHTQKLNIIIISKNIIYSHRCRFFWGTHVDLMLNLPDVFNHNDIIC